MREKRRLISSSFNEEKDNSWIYSLGSILCDVLHQEVFIFVDDILIDSGTWDSHLKFVDEVLPRSEEHNLQALVGKCHVQAQQEKHLGSEVTSLSRQPDPDEVKAIRELQPSKPKKEIRSK